MKKCYERKPEYARDVSLISALNRTVGRTGRYSSIESSTPEIEKSEILEHVGAVRVKLRLVPNSVVGLKSQFANLMSQCKNTLKGYASLASLLALWSIARGT